MSAFVPIGRLTLCRQAKLRRASVIVTAILFCIALIVPPCWGQSAADPPEPPPVEMPSGADVLPLPTPPSSLEVKEPSPPAGSVVRAILGLFLLLALAYVAGQPALLGIERRLAVNPMVTSGLVFVFLGTLAARNEIGVLTDFTLRAIAPIVPLGLGWIGFRTGFRFDRKLIAAPPPSAFVVLAVVVPLLATVAGAYGVVALLFPEIMGESSTFRDALLLGLASAMTSPASVTMSVRRSLGSEHLAQILDYVKVEHATGVAGLLLVSLYFRPEGHAVAWNLPATGWLFIALGIGVTMGILTHLMLQMSRQSSGTGGPQFIVVLLGSICMTAGLASYLRLSAIGLCFVAGMVVSLLPGDWRDNTVDILDRMERPIYFVLLLVAGALWLPGRWQLWVLAAAFFLARFLGKAIALNLGSRLKWITLPSAVRRLLVLEPVGPFAIAIIITGRDLYPLGRTPGLLTAVIGGLVLNEVVSQFLSKSPTQESA